MRAGGSPVSAARWMGNGRSADAAVTHDTGDVGPDETGSGSESVPRGDISSRALGSSNSLTTGTGRCSAGSGDSTSDPGSGSAATGDSGNRVVLRLLGLRRERRSAEGRALNVEPRRPCPR